MLNQIAAKIPEASRALALALACAFALSAACGAPPAPAAPATAAPAAPAPTPAKPAAVDAPESVGAQPAPSAPSPAALSIPARGETTPEELIFLSTVVARVRLLSAEAAVRRYPSEYRRAPDPVLAFRFRAIEYLKGSGGDELAVRVLVLNSQYGDVIYIHPSPSPTPDADAALRIAKDTLAKRDARWDGLEAVVFLRPSPLAGESGVYEFTARMAGAALHGYAVAAGYAHIPAWLPGGVPSVKASADAAADSSSPEPRYFTRPPSVRAGADITSSFIAGFLSPDSPTASSLALSEIKSFIAAHADMMAKGKDIPGYEECVKDRFEFDALYKKHPRRMTFFERRIPSGQPAGHGLDDNPYVRDPAPYYDRQWFAGADSDLFAQKITDDPDNDPATGYAWETVVLRPVPKGEYKVFANSQPSAWAPCGYNPEAVLNRHEVTFIATAPARAVHEAFFDPASMGNGGGAGADSANGVLKPTMFTFGGASVSLDSIRWESQAVEMRLSPRARLSNHHADFIALDGSVSLRLDFDDATETGEGDSRALSWKVCVQPWQDGDLLMLRISESQPDLIGATRDGDCAGTP